MLRDIFRRVVIVGGTHGNELTGVWLVRKFQGSPALAGRQGFCTELLLANPEAIKLGRRYVDRDLNRCFRASELQQPASNHEEHRAREIAGMLDKDDFILDLHSTTANVGYTFILANTHPLNLAVAAAVQQRFPELPVRIYRWTHGSEDDSFLKALSPFGFSLEVGAIAQGVLDARIFENTEKLIQAVLDVLQTLAAGDDLSLPDAVTVYQHTGTLDYPRNADGSLAAMLHPDRLGRDFQPVHPGMPLFRTFDGQDVPFEGDTTVWPVLMNEAAYMEKGIAMCVTVEGREALR